MRLDRLTPTQHFEIKAPRWKERVVGLAAHNVGNLNTIEILAADKMGKRYYPHRYAIKGEDVKVHPTQTLPSGLKVYLVPISSLETVEGIAPVDQPCTLCGRRQMVAACNNGGCSE